VPRAGWRKPESGERLSDHISIGVLTHVYPPALVDAVIAETGKHEQRHRLLPARVVMYYVMAMALFSQDAYEEVMRRLVDGLSWLAAWRTGWTVPTKAAIFKGRARLGAEPLRMLFRTVAKPLGSPASRGVWYRNWRVMSIDGSTLDVADTPENDAHFGRPGHSRGGEPSAFPQIRLAALAESGTHAIIDAAMGPYKVHESKLTLELLPSLQAGMLCLADRGFFSYALWQEAVKTRADLLWRVTKSLLLSVLQELPDGSYLSRVYASDHDRQHDRNGITVRVIEYTIDDPGRPQADTVHRLICTILDATAAPADELAALYCERWEFETTLDELKTHQRGPRVVLRSKTPEGVLQELYGYLLTHYAIRALMHEAAAVANEDPDRLSFIRSLRVIRRNVDGAKSFSP
jgi:hypothetical protein